MFALVSNSGIRPLGPSPVDAEQSSSFVSITIASAALARRKLLFSTGGGPRPSMPSARSMAANWCSNPQPDSPSAAIQANTSSMFPV